MKIATEKQSFEQDEAGIYFENILKSQELALTKREVIIKTGFICRQSSQRVIMYNL